MGDIAIRVEGLSKQYRIGKQEKYRTFRDTLTDAVTAPFKRTYGLLRGNAAAAANLSETIWALKDISFEVKKGEVVGIIGRNGAGKSTLLKILSRITEPTEGEAKVYGRVGALLEVGTGFHSELTGRENIYLNAAILGMKRAEISRKFDEIVAFAEVEKFIDTPVKHYSSGMGLRLGFAVAAHLEPEILIVDEVLAVGDAAFQKKCLGKMGEVAGEGRTVLYVSHNMGSVANLCSRCVWLDQGRVTLVDVATRVIDSYLRSTNSLKGEIRWPVPENAPGNENVRLNAVRVISASTVSSDVRVDEDICIEIDYWNLREGVVITPVIHLRDRLGSYVLVSGSLASANLTKDEWFDAERPVGLFRSTCVIPANFLNTSQYHVDVGISIKGKFELQVEYAISFEVQETGAMTAEYAGSWVGVVRPRLAWQTVQLDSVITGVFNGLS